MSYSIGEVHCMELSGEELEILLKIPKDIIVGDVKLEQLNVPDLSPFFMKYNLLSDDGQFLFLLEVEQSAKQALKISLHVQDDESKIGLLRIDYRGKHKNPEIVNEYVPNLIKPYAGKLFKYEEHHIHYHVQGYPQLVWAVPLTVDSFSIKEITEFSSLRRAVLEFAELVNLRTKIIIEERLFL